MAIGAVVVHFTGGGFDQTQFVSWAMALMWPFVLGFWFVLALAAFLIVLFGGAYTLDAVAALWRRFRWKYYPYKPRRPINRRG